MSLDTQQKAVKRALRKKPQTAAELAVTAGYDSGRAISKALGAAVQSGVAKRVDGRPIRYARP